MKNNINDNVLIEEVPENIPKKNFGLKWRDISRKKSNYVKYTDHKGVNNVVKIALKTLKLPASFDWRTVTGTDGKSVITEAEDQGGCGSCYAFATINMLQDRISIHSNGQLKQVLSKQDMVNCGNAFVNQYLVPPTDQVKQLINQGILLDSDSFALEGCDGGLFAGSINYLVLQGVPIESAEPYTGTQAACNPINTTRYRGIKGEDLIPEIENGFPIQQITKSAARLQEDEENMKDAIYLEGPISAALNIYTKFLYYPNGGDVYINTPTFTLNGRTFTNRFEGSHAVEIVGWGFENGIDYWICKNSWGKSFGDNGYFKIRRGTNECNIEIDAVGIQVDMNQLTVDGNILTAEPVNSSISTVAIVFIVLGVLLVVGLALGLGLYYGLKDKRESSVESELI